jgi:starch synthase
VKILLASSELHPYSKTGGLADMVAALAKSLARHGHQVGVVTPLYLGIRERFPEIRRLDLPLDLPLGNLRVTGEIWTLQQENLTVYFLDQPGFYQRPTLYQQFGIDFPDNAERFIYFSKVVAHLALHLPSKPELLHVHDWQSALAALFVRHQRRLPGWENAPRTCLTIHNLAYQGVFSAAHFALTNLPWDYFNHSTAEFFGQMNCLKSGIARADVITTVSPRYAREICSEALGCGLDGLLRFRGDSLVGILNGVDYEVWNTTNDPYLKEPYSAEDLSGKERNKLTLQKEAGLAIDATIPLFGSIGRLVEQKGVDIMLAAMDEMLAANCQFLLLGSGSAAFERAYSNLAARYPHKARVFIGFDEGFSHRIEAGADFFLMPSHFEPCGLNQMYSLRYGTIPIVRRTGGLDDSVTDISEDETRADGIKFSDYSSRALAKSIRKGLVLFPETELVAHYRKNGMRKDFSWDRISREYERVYGRVLDTKGNNR